MPKETLFAAEPSRALFSVLEIYLLALTSLMSNPFEKPESGPNALWSDVKNLKA